MKQSEGTEVVTGSDFGVPASAGQQAKKIILIEAVRMKKRAYTILPTGRNERLVRTLTRGSDWRENRRGWTVPELAHSLASDPAVSVCSFDFPFSIPTSLLNDIEFAALVKRPVFKRRSVWAKYMGKNLKLTFPTDHAKAKLADLAKFKVWRDKRFWKKRQTDEATGGSAPLKDKYQNVFAMTLAGTALLERLAEKRFVLSLSSASMPANRRAAFETYPAAVASAIGFSGNYKKNPDKCLEQAERFLSTRKIILNFSNSVRQFCLDYRTNGKTKDDLDPDGADAFLCLVASICFRENLAELCCGIAAPGTLNEEGCIIIPRMDGSRSPNA